MLTLTEQIERRKRAMDGRGATSKRNLHMGVPYKERFWDAITYEKADFLFLETAKPSINP